MTVKANNAVKEHEVFKENLYTTIQGSLYVQNGNSINKSFNFGPVVDSLALTKDSPSKAHRRYTSTSNLNDNLPSMTRGGVTSKKLSQTDILSN